MPNQKKLRIFLCIGGKATPTDNNNMWVKNLYDPLIVLEHDVYLLDIDNYAKDNGLGYMSTDAKERLSNELPSLFLSQHSKKPFDIFFSYLHDGQIFPSVLKEIAKHIFTINYSTNFHQFGMYKEIAQNVHSNIYISKIGKEGFDELGVKSYWMPLAGNSSFYQPSKIKNKKTVFIGSQYGPRALLFWRLFQYGIDLHLYGYGWQENKSDNDLLSENLGIKNQINQFLEKTTGYQIKKNFNPVESNLNLQNLYDNLNLSILDVVRKNYNTHLHPSLSDLDYVKTLAEAGTVINMQESRFNHDFTNHRVLFGSNLRDYETTLCGSFLCTQFSEEIEELFEVGKEVICYHNEHDLADKIKFFDAHGKEKQQIALRGYNKSIQKHTWKNRFNDFFSTINI